MWGSYYSIPTAIFYLLKGGYRPLKSMYLRGELHGREQVALGYWSSGRPAAKLIIVWSLNRVIVGLYRDI